MSSQPGLELVPVAARWLRTGTLKLGLLLLEQAGSHGSQFRGHLGLLPGNDYCQDTCRQAGPVHFQNIAVCCYSLWGFIFGLLEIS